MTRLILGFAIFTFLLPFNICIGESPDVLPDELAPGVPKTEMMSVWLKKRVLDALDRRDAAFETLTNEKFTTWQKKRRDFFLHQLGGFPERTPLNAKVTGRLEIDDYRIEKLYFESQPGLHVTATLYLPQGNGPFPVVLHPTGHSASAKNRELYQQASIVIVKGGCAVLCYDPIGQGERKQLFKKDGKPYASTVQHTLINQASHLLGSNVAQTMVWDGMRAIDYLKSRPDIMADKIGCTGISGGGTNTSYLMALDDRITAAAPGCYLTGFRSLYKTIGPQDAEQNIHGQIAFGMDHTDYVLMRLPKPTLIMAATQDYFDINGAWNIFRAGKRFATRQGFPERIDLVEPNTKHGFPTEMRVAAANWMRRWLLDLDSPIVEGTLKPLSEEKLNATPNGRVLDLKGARTIFELNADWNKTFASRRAENAKPEHRDRLRVKVRELIGARKLADLPEPTVKKVADGHVITSETGIQLPAKLVGDVNSERFTILLHGAGKHEAIKSGEVKRVANELKSQVLAVDLRGLGETKKTGRVRSFDDMFGSDWKDTTTASLLGKTYVGMRAEDIWQIVRAMRKETGNETLKPHLIAIGEAAIPTLHAAALEPDLFGEVRISGAIDSWTAVVESSLARNQQSNLVFGALREYDLPMLRQLLGDQLTVNGAVNPDGTHAAIIPAVPRSSGKMGRHKKINKRVSEGNVDLVFIGDSITSGWENRGAKVWEKFYSKRNAVNLGIGGDRTQHVIWRLDNGNIKGISPKAAVVMIGTNNSRDNTSEQIAEGVKGIVEQLRNKLPDTKVLLLAIFPRGENNDDTRRQVTQKTNAKISKLADGNHVHYLDIGSKFMNDNGVLTRGMMPDQLHLSQQGYEIWAESIESKLCKLLGE
ncbi:MAG: acetylxylan esterase [Planctomycetes bacterium]|nr:acetylxylan esterase [Planctomycetota bacterium]MCH9726927.1 acetylxylan esterase [Planctomycetota bacterium]MCH9775611.1 acetylxylan esterase [Planctomycetota bacterium]MCH9793623.1 acetylxylan esterase [Planctomycetota bacterium]